MHLPICNQQFTFLIHWIILFFCFGTPLVIRPTLLTNFIESIPWLNDFFLQTNLHNNFIIMLLFYGQFSLFIFCYRKLEYLGHSLYLLCVCCFSFIIPITSRAPAFLCRTTFSYTYRIAGVKSSVVAPNDANMILPLIEWMLKNLKSK